MTSQVLTIQTPNLPRLPFRRDVTSTTGTPDAISPATWGVYRRAVQRDLGEDVYELAAERRHSADKVVTFPARAVLGIDD
jgi:hypothetical protein